MRELRFLDRVGQTTIALTIIGFLVVIPLPLHAQSSAGEGATVEPTQLIDKPTAGMLSRGGYSLSASFFQKGGVLMGVSVGLLDRFSFGISYGGTDVIGAGTINMNPSPGVNVKLRIFEESLVVPAIVLGFDSQGKDPYIDSLSRYTIKSLGFYAVASKNYAIMGNLSVHGGINISMERNDGDRDANLFAGLEKSLGKDISLLAEFDFATNDDNDHALGRGRGYLNVGLRWGWGRGLVIGFDLKNITKNQEVVGVGNRTMQLEYVGHF